MKKEMLISIVLFFIMNCSVALSGNNILIALSNKSGYPPLSSFVTDTSTSRYFPLAVGNVYKYHYAASNGFNYDYKVRILKDTVINSRRYFIADHLFPANIRNIIRYDSITGNIYGRVNSGYCSYSPFEELIDSLRSKKGDSAVVCTYELKHYCTDTGYTTLFGNQIKKKGFTRYVSDITISVTYGMDFGIIFTVYSDFLGLASESLVGCYINGVLYGDTILTDIENITSAVPSSFLLFQNYPNPFNPTTNLEFGIPDWGFVSLKVYDVLGNEVKTLVKENKPAGSYRVEFDGSNFPSGIYFYKLEAGDFIEVKKMTLLK